MRDKSHMFWGNKDVHYLDGHSIPRVTYRCKHKATKGEGLSETSHGCKLVTDHPGNHECICGKDFGEKVPV